MSLDHTDNQHNITNPQLSPKHRAMLDASAVAPAVREESGVYSTDGGAELPPGFSKRQRRLGPGILFKIHRPDGDTAWCFRPDKPDPKNPGAKYEVMPKLRPGRKHGGPGNVLYVHPSQRHLVAHLDVPVIFVEGIKKALAIISAAREIGVEVLVVGVTGTWNWMSDHRPIPDMHEVPVQGREASVWYDSDMLRNPSVQLAASRLAEHLIERGARVGITYMHDHADGSKMGADDYLVAGGTLEGARALTRPYDLADFAVVRSSRDE
ncbi:MAG: DUF3854 domain-containing protein, partial [Actinomycetota bacterium]|nr:DUF3854 domain-containing protein [Actinomycetota bacterium]